MSKIFLIFIISLISYYKISEACTGCLDLDELTFEKTIKKFRTVLVKFDQSFPYGDNHERYAEFAQQISNKSLTENDHPDVIVATVGIKDYGDNENKKLGDKYGVSSTKLPVIKLFIDGNLDAPIDFNIGSEAFKITELFIFLKQHSQVSILAPGCDEKLDKLADRFMKNEKNRSEVLKEAEKLVEKIKCEKKRQLLKFYTALMKGVIEKGDDFISTQNERLAKLLKDKISKKKQEEINKKLNIASSFQTPLRERKEEL